mmetsp:Transcript_37616/g.118430  ORF Transcript_37616/g.118430 Transcript_37616/m.118430 type:complete len:204 (-) Transcript_37616:191-802(-)
MRAAPAVTASARPSSIKHASSAGHCSDATSGLQGRPPAFSPSSSLTSHWGSTFPPPSTPPSCRRSLPRTAPRCTRSAASIAARAKVSKPVRSAADAPPRCRCCCSMRARSRPMVLSRSATSAVSSMLAGTSNNVLPSATAPEVTSAKRSASPAGTTLTASQRAPPSSSQSSYRRAASASASHSGGGGCLTGCFTLVTRESSDW